MCRRHDGHSGKHQAQRRLRGVGNTIWQWKTQPSEILVIESPFLEPEVMVKIKTWAPKESVTRPTCKCDGLRHKCKRYRGLYR